MMKTEKKSKCAICGKEYKVCASCGDVKTFKPWRTITDSINCYKIYSAIIGYTNGYSDKEETAEMLSRCDLSAADKFLPEIAAKIRDIIGDYGKETYKGNL